MSYIWFTLSLKRTTLASDEGMPDLLMTWALGLRHATSLQSHMDVSVRPPTMLNCVYIHLLHYEPLEGRSCNFYFFLPTPYHSARHTTRVGYCSLLVLSNHWDTLFCGEGRERKPAGKEESLKDSVYVYVCVRAQLLSHVRLFVTPWTVAYQDPLFMGFSRQEYWSGLPFPPPGHPPDPGIEPLSPALAGGDSLPLSHLGSPIEMLVVVQSPSPVRLFGTPWTAACQVFHWRREWQTIPVYLPLEPHELYKKKNDRNA